MNACSRGTCKPTLALLDISDAIEHFGRPGFETDIIEFCGRDQVGHKRGALAAAFITGR